MNVAIAAITTQKYKDRQLAVRSTWGRNVPGLIFISDEEDIENNVIKVTGDISYNSNPIKVYGAIKFLYNNKREYDWFLIVDDDTYVNYSNLVKFLETQSLDKIEMIGFVNKYTSTYDEYLCYISGGAGHLFNRKTLQILKTMSINDLVTIHADVCLGVFCEKNNITLSHNHLQHPGHLDNIYNYGCDKEDQYVKATKEKIKEGITFHYITPKYMKYIYEIILYET